MWRTEWFEWIGSRETVKWMTCRASPVSCYLVRPTCVLVDHPVRAAPRARTNRHMTWRDSTNTPSKSTTEYWPSQSTRIGYKELNWEWSQWMQRSSRWRRWRGWVECDIQQLLYGQTDSQKHNNMFVTQPFVYETSNIFLITFHLNVK